MSSFEELSSPEYGSDNQAFIGLVNEISFAVDDAFDEMGKQRLSKGRAITELIQIDTHSIEGEELFSVLLTESGGKPEIGSEKVRILARPSRDYSSLSEAIDSLHEDHSVLPFQSDSFFIAHQARDGEWRYSRVDEAGIYPWRPQIKDKQADMTDDPFVSIDILELLNKSETPAERVERLKRDRQMRQLDIAYARYLIAKINEWPVVPQN